MTTTKHSTGTVAKFDRLPPAAKVGLVAAAIIVGSAWHVLLTWLVVGLLT